MKRNKPTRHSSPGMRPYGRSANPYDQRETHKGSERIELKAELRKEIELSDEN